AEPQSVVSVMPEIVLALLGELRSLTGIHWHPAATLDVELRPAMIAGDQARAASFRERTSNSESGRYPNRAGHANDERVEVGAITPLCFAGEYRITATPACAALVIGHHPGDPVVDRPSFLGILGQPASDLQ